MSGIQGAGPKMKRRTPVWLIKEYKNLILDKIFPLRKIETDGLTFFYKRDPPHDPYELQTQGFEFHKKIKDLRGEMAIDIGANIGSYALRLAIRFQSVIAFEPNPVHSRLLRLNVASNNLRNVHVEEVALSDRNDLMPLYIRPGGATSLDPSHYGRKYDKVCLVKVMKLDDFQLPLGRLDFVKIDAENLELPILRGGRQSLTKFGPLLAVEVHKARMVYGHVCRCDVCSFLEDLGYHTEVTGAFSSSMGSVHWVWAIPPREKEEGTR